MKHIPLQLAILATLAAGAVAGQTYALEAATTGSQASQAVVGAINSKVDTSIAALQAQITGIVYCNSIRKFYAPSDPKKDANGCVGMPDYDYTATNNSGLYVSGSRASDFMGRFTNTNPTYGYGVYGQGNGGVGVYGISTANYGVYGNSTNSWGGVFQGTQYGVYGAGSVYGVYSNGPLCTSATGCSRRGFGGTFTWNTDGWCGRANPETGACSCPSGFSAQWGASGFSHYDIYICE
jgi:hypothetical protein